MIFISNIFILLKDNPSNIGKIFDFYRHNFRKNMNYG